MRKKSILFVGHCYYNHYYLAKELKKLGWRADVINIDLTPSSQMFYHGQDYVIYPSTISGILKNLIFFIKSLFRYKLFHFSNAEHMRFPPFSNKHFTKIFGEYEEIRLLKYLGKVIFYTNNGCRDGVTQKSFNKWGPLPVCNICPWKMRPDVCSDEKNERWGRMRNKYADFIGTLGSNRADFNLAPHVHEAPWMYSLDKDVWNPILLIPSNYKLPYNEKTIKIFHSVGNYDTRSHGLKKITIKSTEIWIDIINRLKEEGYDVEMIFFKDVPNKQLKYYQAQADIFVDMLTFGFFGANIREAMMMGKPAICFLRPEWLEDMAKELPDYVDELPVVSATPDTAYEILKDLIENEFKRKELGHEMRKFGLKWHASDVSAIKADEIYRSYL